MKLTKLDIIVFIAAFLYVLIALNSAIKFPRLDDWMLIILPSSTITGIAAIRAVRLIIKKVK